MSTPQVSVLLCVHNGERFLRSTLDSAFKQTFSDFELIVVDDESTDGSRKIIRGYDDPRIRFIEQSRQGAAGALRTALEAACGEYIALLDQDDLWREDKLARHIETHRNHSEIDLTFSWFQVINDAGVEIGLGSNRFRGTIDFQGLLADFVIGGSSNVVIRKYAIERVGGVDPALPRMYDLDLCLRVALLTPHNVLAIPEDLMLYRRHGLQITRDLDSLQREWEKVLHKFEALSTPDFPRMARQARSNMNRYFAALAYEEGNHKRALRFLSQGWRDLPYRFWLDSRNWRTLCASLSGFVLPASLHKMAERRAGLHRE